ncbi:MAG: methyl-accepting chemotaxis protein [Marinisporobacter sp.]|nr:methyl-accepting chemotaxis protein [Marinisporobacter sp.]
MMRSIGKKLVVYFSVLVLTICASFGFFAYRTMANGMVHEVEKLLPQKAEEACELIQSKISERFTFLEGVASRDTITSEQSSIEDKLAILKEIEEKQDYLRMGVADTKGNLYLTDYYGEKGKIGNILNRTYYKEALAGKRGLLEPSISINPNEPAALIMVYSVPIKRNDKIVGALVAIGDGTLLSKITNQISFGNTGYVYVVNEKGRTIADQDVENVLRQENVIEEAKTNKELVSAAKQVERMISGEKFGYYDYQGVSVYTGFASIENTGWFVGVGAQKNEVLEELPEIQRQIALMTGSFLVLGIVFVFFIGRAIAKPIVLATSYAEKIATLDIREDIPDQLKLRKDELGKFYNAFQLVIDNMRIFIGQVQESAEQVASASEELKATSEESAKTSEHVAGSTEEVADNAAEQMMEVLNVTSSIEEIYTNIEDVSSNAQNMYILSSNVLQESEIGKKEINKVIKQMNHIGKSTNEVRTSLVGITDSSQKINDIIYVIQGISEQTNLLALNAAIEAARAGEVGKGFAVVAEEVRKLAEETQNATEQIKQLLDKNQENIYRTNTTMNGAVKEVEKGTEIVTETEKAFKNIMDLIEKVNKQIAIIVKSIDHVSNKSQNVVASTNKIEETSKAVSEQIQNVSAATQEQTASMEELASSSESLSQLAQELQETITKFKF